MNGQVTRRIAPRRVAALIGKESLQVVRDPSAILIAFVLPVILMLLFSYAVSLDIRSMAVGVVREAADHLLLDAGTETPRGRAGVKTRPQNSHVVKLERCAKLTDLSDLRCADRGAKDVEHTCRGVPSVSSACTRRPTYSATKRMPPTYVTPHGDLNWPGWEPLAPIERKNSPAGEKTCSWCAVWSDTKSSVSEAAIPHGSIASAPLRKENLNARSFVSATTR